MDTKININLINFIFFCKKNQSAKIKKPHPPTKHKRIASEAFIHCTESFYLTKKIRLSIDDLLK